MLAKANSTAAADPSVLNLEEAMEELKRENELLKKELAAIQGIDVAPQVRTQSATGDGDQCSDAL